MGMMYYLSKLPVVGGVPVGEIVGGVDVIIGGLGEETSVPGLFVVTKKDSTISYLNSIDTGMFSLK